MIDLNADQRFVRQDPALGALAAVVFALALHDLRAAQDGVVLLYRDRLITYAEMEEVWDRVLDRLQAAPRSPHPLDRDQLCFTANLPEPPSAA